MAQNQQLHTDIHPINRRYKDSLFRIAFREKKELLELYNAINGSDYKNPDELTIYTLEDIIFMNMKNDISFILCHMMNVYEQQSTYNPNMPEDFEIREFLIGHKAEVKDMCITEYNEAGTLQMIREESREEGDLIRAKKTASNMLKDGDSIDKIARILELPADIIRSWSEEAGMLI